MLSRAKKIMVVAPIFLSWPMPLRHFWVHLSDQHRQCFRISRPSPPAYITQLAQAKIYKDPKSYLFQEIAQAKKGLLLITLPSQSLVRITRNNLKLLLLLVPTKSPLARIFQASCRRRCFNQSYKNPYRSSIIPILIK
jgi:hypothetical protein